MNTVRSSTIKLSNNDRRYLQKYPKTYMEYSYLEVFTEEKAVKLSSKEEKRKITNENISNSKWLDN